MNKTFAVVAAITLLYLGVAAQASSVPVYNNDFQGVVGTEWSNSTTDVTPIGARRFLGQFTNDNVTLSLSDLVPHNAASVAFDLFILRSWDGNYDHPSNPLNLWSFGLAGGPSLITTTFAQYPNPAAPAGYEQSYPGSYPDGHFAMRTGASENNTLGYTFTNQTVFDAPMDSVYHLSFTFPHNSGQLALSFAGLGLQGLDSWVNNAYFDESWGIDNVAVSVNAVPEPSSLIALGSGLLALGGFIRRRR